MSEQSMDRTGSMARVFLGITLLLLTFTSYADAQTGLVSWWKAEGNANDSVDGNHGTLQNGVTFTTGKDGQAFSFDGVDDAISILKSNNLNFGSGDFSVAAWVKFTKDFPGSGDVVIFGNYAGVEYYGLGIEANGEHAVVGFRDAAENEIRVIGAKSLNDGQWHHLVGVRSGITGLVYVDGLLDGSLTVPKIGAINTGTCLYA